MASCLAVSALQVRHVSRFLYCFDGHVNVDAHVFLSKIRCSLVNSDELIGEQLSNVNNLVELIGSMSGEARGLYH